MPRTIPLNSYALPQVLIVPDDLFGDPTRQSALDERETLRSNLDSHHPPC